MVAELRGGICILGAPLSPGWELRGRLFRFRGRLFFVAVLRGGICILWRHFHLVGSLRAFFYIKRAPTMNFRPREALFFGDNFFRFGPIGSKFSHLTFQPKRRFLSIWSVNKKIDN